MSLRESASVLESEPTTTGNGAEGTGLRHLAPLHAAVLLNALADPAFDRLARLATTTLAAQAALVSLVDEDRQFIKGVVGVPEPWASARETPLSQSFRQHVITAAEPLVLARLLAARAPS